MADCLREDDEERRLRRLAIVLTAQLPGDPKKAGRVLRYIRELVDACDDELLPNRAICGSPNSFCWFDLRKCVGQEPV